MMMDPGFGFSSFENTFAIVLVIVVIGFIVVIGSFIVMAVRGTAQWHRNNQSPRLTVEARVVTKRQNISHHHSGDHMSTTSSRYYVTFQVESGDRMELQMTGPEYGMLAEGDRGRLTFQGTRYVSFERE